MEAEEIEDLVGEYIELTRQLKRVLERLGANMVTIREDKHGIWWSRVKVKDEEKFGVNLGS